VKVCLNSSVNKSSAVAYMGAIDMDLRGDVPLSREVLGTRLLQCSLHGGLLAYQVVSSSTQPFGHNSVGCHSLRRNTSTNYYFVLEMHTVTVRSDDARYLLKNLSDCLV